MYGSTRQTYLGRARATLAARESWRSVFETSPTHDGLGHPEPTNPSTGTVDGIDATRHVDSESLCDKSDQSDKTPLLDTDHEVDVTWRVKAMRRQIRPGPPLIIPFLVARRDFADAPGRCMSCGDPCGPCVRAAEIVVNEAWEGRHRPVDPAPRGAAS